METPNSSSSYLLHMPLSYLSMAIKAVRRTKQRKMTQIFTALTDAIPENQGNIHFLQILLRNILFIIAVVMLGFR